MSNYLLNLSYDIECNADSSVYIKDILPINILDLVSTSQNNL